MALIATEIPSVPSVPEGGLPTPPRLSFHTYENNEVTLIKPKITCQNKQLTLQSHRGITLFPPKTQQFSCGAEAAAVHATASQVVDSQSSCSLQACSSSSLPICSVPSPSGISWSGSSVIRTSAPPAAAISVQPTSSAREARASVQPRSSWTCSKARAPFTSAVSSESCLHPTRSSATCRPSPLSR